MVINTFVFASCWTLLRDVVVKHELVSRAKLCLVSVLPHIAKVVLG